MTFTGLVRSDPKDPVSTLTLECYPELAMNQIGAVEAKAVARFGLLKATIIHRYGKLQPGEPIVQVMTLAPHRRAAFEGQRRWPRESRRSEGDDRRNLQHRRGR